MKAEAQKIQFMFKALAVLLLGLGADALLSLSGLSFLQPRTGYYGGYYFTSIHQPDTAVYSLRITGESGPRWHWFAPHNFTYSRLQLSWYLTPVVYEDMAAHPVGADRKTSGDWWANVDLPSQRYQTGTTNGVLTAEVLIDWLLPQEPRPVIEKERQQIEAILATIHAAGAGTLPPPDRKMHKLDGVSSARFHARTGPGITFLGYGWLVVWAIATLKKWKRLFSNQLSLELEKPSS